MFTQKKRDTEITFDFKESTLSYKLKDSTWTATFKTPYVEINIQDIDEFVEQNDWLKNVWILWIFLWFGLQFLADQNNPWLLIGLICLIVFYFRRTRYSKLKAYQWTIYIIQNKEHKEILEKIKERKREILREKLYFYNQNNDHETELEKYEFLKEEWAITEEEYNKISQELFKKMK